MSSQKKIAPAPPDDSPLWRPMSIGHLELANRLVALPVFSGYAYPDGRVSRLMLEHYGRLGDSGVGLVVVAIFAATMSALSSEYNIIAAVCTKDIYHGLIKKDKPINDKILLWMGRCSTIVVAFLCTLMGSQIDKLGGSFKYLFIIRYVY